MRRTLWPALLVLLVVLSPGAAQAQIFYPYGGGISLGFTRVQRNFGFSFSLSRSYRGFYGGFYGAPYYGPYFGGPSISRVQIITPPPPPPIIIQAPPVPADVLLPPAVELPPFDAVMRPQAPAEQPLPGREAGRFRPLDPGNRDRARQPFKPEAPKEPPRKEPPAPKEPPKERPIPRLPRGPQPNVDPRVESARQVALGKAAFAEGEYGRAAERFRRAVIVAPGEALPHFLLAQAHLALGNYRRAFAAIQSGLALKPDWPSEPFRPVELYGANVADYADHQAALANTLAANPNDALLLFLRAYSLWYDGRKLEARPLLERAAPGLPDRGIVERFLRALPGVPVV
jgi:Tetratricopeptide repeat